MTELEREIELEARADKSRRESERQKLMEMTEVGFWFCWMSSRSGV